MKRADLKVGTNLQAHFFRDVFDAEIKYVAADFIVVSEDTGDDDERVYTVREKSKRYVNYGGIWTDKIFVYTEMESNKPLYCTAMSEELPYNDFIATQYILEPIIELFHKKGEDARYYYPLDYISDIQYTAEFTALLSKYGYYSVPYTNNGHTLKNCNSAFPLWDLKNLLVDVVDGIWAISLAMAVEFAALFWRYFNTVICVTFGENEQVNGF